MGKSPTEETAKRVEAAEERFREHQKNMREHGVVELGGESLTPSHVQSYLRAIEMLNEHAGDELTDIALPLLYLHRHTFELVLKRAINACADIADFRRKLEAATGSVTTPQLAYVNTGHNLQKLAETLRTHTTTLGIAAPLDEIDSFAAHCNIIEKDDPTRLRYEKDTKGKRSYSAQTKAMVGLRGTHKTFMNLMAKLVPVDGGDQHNLSMRLLAEWAKLEARYSELKGPKRRGAPSAR